MNPTGVLAPYRVLDLTDESGFSCGKILADLGADVIKVEPPGGDPARYIDNLYFISYNAGKRGITLNLQTARGLDVLHQISERADFLIETFPPGTLAQWGLSFETLRQLNPRLIAELFLRYTKSEFLEEAFKREIIGYPVANARDILDDPHLKDREFWRTLDPSLFGEPIRFPGIFAQFSESVPPAFRTAPRLGQHNDTIYQGELGLPEGEIARLRKEKVL